MFTKSNYIVYCFWNNFKFLLFVFIITKQTNAEQIPYPYVLLTNENDVLKQGSKLDLNTTLNIKNTAKILLTSDLSMSFAESIFSLKKLPDQYIAQISKGLIFIDGKGKELILNMQNSKLQFNEGKNLLFTSGEITKLLVFNNSNIVLEFKNKKTKLKNNSFYEIKNNELAKEEKIKDLNIYITKICEISDYRNLISHKRPKETKPIYKTSGKSIFCIKNETGLDINNWYLNTDTTLINKKIMKEKYLKTCSDKFAKVQDAAEYEVLENNCLFVNNLICQNIKVKSNLDLIELSSVLLSPYDIVFIKNSKNEYEEIKSKWLLLVPGTYFFKLGTKIENSILYIEKTLKITSPRNVKLSEL